MTTNIVIVDTDVLIDASRGVSEAISCLQQVEQQSSLAISVITQMELFIGCRDKTELRTVEDFLSRFQIIRLNEQISDVAVDLLRCYRLSHGLLIADSFIAATAVIDRPILYHAQSAGVYQAWSADAYQAWSADAYQA
jgi:predicted nucleic acid-binding protein